MTLQELAEILHRMHFDTEDGEAVAMIHLFCTKYAENIKAPEASKKAIAKAAGLGKS